MVVERNRAVFTEAPTAVPDGNVDVSGGGRWKIWQNAGTKIDAPILGNGDLLAAVAGDGRYPQFWFTTNDFWQMESAANWEFFHDNSSAKCDPAVSGGSPRPVGRMVFDIPAMEGARWYTEQKFATGETITILTNSAGEKCSLKSWVAADENILVVEFESETDLDVEFDFYFPDETGKGCEKAVDVWGSGESENVQNGMFVGLVTGRPLQVKKTGGGIVSGYRQFSDHVDIPTKVGFAGGFLKETKVIGGVESLASLKKGSIIFTEESGNKSNKAVFTEPSAGNGILKNAEAVKAFGNTGKLSDRSTHKKIKAGKRATFVLPVRSWAKCSRPYEYAFSRARWITEEDVETLHERHLVWWKKFWSVSEISLDDPVIEQRYNMSKYMLASVSRDPEYPPNILGISTFYRPAWNGNYKINYNHQSPYLNLMVSGHFQQSDPHDAPYLKLMEISDEMCKRLLHHEGLYYPLGLGPLGLVSEALLLHMKSPAIHGALNMIYRYGITEDEAYAQKVYPYLRGVADFWEKDLVCRDGVYHVVGDGMHERTDGNIRDNGVPEDPVNTLGYLKTFFTWMPRISEALDLDEKKREKWLEIAENLAPYPKGTIREIQENPTLWKEVDVKLEDLLPEEMLDKEIYYDEGIGGKWSFHFPGNVMQIYPCNEIGLGSAPEDLDVERNTVQIHALVENALGELEYRKALEEAEFADKDNANNLLFNSNGELENGEAYSNGMESGGVKNPHFYKAGAFNASNLSCLFFTAAVRVGYAPEIIWKEMRDMILNRGIPNGFLKENPHGIEQLNTIPDAIQEMMLQSCEGMIRIFPVWPRAEHPNAFFRNFRAWGGLEVSAALKDGEVERVSILSHKGHPCRVENPWPGKSVKVSYEYGRPDEVHFGEYLNIELYKEEHAELFRI